jgi:hypothetical protein
MVSVASDGVGGFDIEMVGKPTDLEETADSPARLHDDETSLGRTCPLMSVDEHSEPAGVDEVDPGDVDPHIAVGAGKRIEMPGKRGRHVCVDLAPDHEVRTVGDDLEAGARLRHGLHVTAE